MASPCTAASSGAADPSTDRTSPNPVLDDFLVLHLGLEAAHQMTATNVSDTLAMALRSSGLERVRVRHRPQLLSDDGRPLGR
jgi:hypothetical protein